MGPLRLGVGGGLMARTESALTTRGVELIQQGQPLRAVAALLGLAPSTLVRACQRAGIVLPRGRRPSA